MHEIETNKEESLSSSIVSVPTENMFSDLVQVNTDDDTIEKNDFEMIREDNNVNVKISQAETKVRDKMRASIKNKVEARMSDYDLSKEEANELEDELMGEMEEAIQNEIEVFKGKLEYFSQENFEEPSIISDEIEHEEHRFYWGGDDLNEMIFYEENS